MVDIETDRNASEGQAGCLHHNGAIVVAAGFQPADLVQRVRR